MLRLLVPGLLTATLLACSAAPEAVTDPDGGGRDAGQADAGGFVGRPEHPCDDIEAWRTVSLAPNGTLTAENVSAVLSVPSRLGIPLNNVISTIARDEPARCTSGATTSCSCPDGGTITFTVTTSSSTNATTQLQCTVATQCGVEGRVVDGASAMRVVAQLEQGQERRWITEAYRYTWISQADFGFYAEALGTQVTLTPRYAVPVSDGVVSVVYDRNTADAPVSVIDAQGTWSCGTYRPMGTCQRGAVSLPFTLR